MIERYVIGDTEIAVSQIAAGGELTRRQAESAAVKALIDAVIGPDTAIVHNADGAPAIDGSEKAISISHSRDYACIAVGDGKTHIGVDIEQQRQQLRRVAQRVLSPEEIDVYAVCDAMLLRAWTMKEALYKAALTPGLDFRRDIRLPLESGSAIALVLGRPYRLDVVTRDEYTLTLASEYRL